MKKTILIITAVAILTVGLISSVYAMDGSRSYYKGLRAPMMYQYNNGNYQAMIDIMKNNGFEAMAKAMENRDFAAMNTFMNNLTDEQYNQMIDIMKNNGYEGMARMMGSFGRNGIVNMHNSMMGRYIR